MEYAIQNIVNNNVYTKLLSRNSVSVSVSVPWNSTLPHVTDIGKRVCTVFSKIGGTAELELANPLPMHC